MKPAQRMLGRSVDAPSSSGTVSSVACPSWRRSACQHQFDASPRDSLRAPAPLCHVPASASVIRVPGPPASTSSSGRSTVLHEACARRRPPACRPRENTPDSGGTTTRLMPSSARQVEGVDAAVAADGDQRQIARIAAALDRDRADRARHGGVGDRADAVRRILDARCRAGSRDVRRDRLLAQRAGRCAAVPPASASGLSSPARRWRR